MNGRVLRLAQQLFVGREEALARRWQARMEDASRPGRRAFLGALSVVPSGGNVIMGAIAEGKGRWQWIGLPSERLIGHHAAIAGGTGTGKTSWLLGVLLQLLLENRFPIVVFDAKGETVDLLLDVFVPFLIANGGEGIVNRLWVIRPFDPAFVPLMNLTLPEPGVPREAQAYGVASAVEQALAEPLGGRMHHCLVRFVVACIELGLPITQILEWLADPRTFLHAADRSRDEGTREYARIGLRQENRESLRALGARLNALLFWPGARRALCAPGTVSFADALAAPGLTVISTGGAPAGSERLARFFGAVLLGKVVRSILSRKTTAESPPALFVAEEIQECLGAEEARQFGRLLATARYKRVATWISGQSRSQIASVDPSLVAAIRANATIQVQFRTSLEDATAFAHLLPEEEGGEAARRDLINAVTRLPQRHCYLAIRDIGLAAQLVLAPRLDFESLRSAEERLTPDVRRKIRQGITAVPVGDAPPLSATKPALTAVKEAPSFPPVVSDERFPGLG